MDIRSQPIGWIAVNVNERERDRLRAKRANTDYLANELRNNAARMAEVRKRRVKEGRCWDCEKPHADDSVYCRKHQLRERRRQRAARQ